jgi:ubiquinone/menaquinone biosynthesis C-methylase UbiE
LLYLLLAQRTVTPQIIREDYDRLSGAYDQYFARHMAKHARELAARLDLTPGARTLDLATGTGNLALALAEAVGPAGEVIGVDQSPGMLARAEARRQQAACRQLRFQEGDMDAVLSEQADNSLDAVTCGWAIGYADPPRLIKTMAAKLKPGGKLGLIENARDTLAPIFRSSLKVAQTFPGHLHQVMDLHRHLPKNQRQLQGWCEAAGLRVLALWEGRVEFNFASGAEVLDWVLHTGASAGFDRMMDPEMKVRCDELFIRLIESEFAGQNRISVAHHYVAGIARKERLACT